ncbi:MAG: hypothetical protein WBD16_07900 [Pyrinomonadaceae bacterium]
MKKILAMSIITISAVMFVHPASATVTACAQGNCRRVCHAELDRCLRNGGGERCRQRFQHCVRRCSAS